ncbi:hypothetical protein Lpp48_03597, partial [Lacticaseibacillus paracasei subsp. paracasei Lpp48]
DRVTDQAFTSLAAAVTQIAERISEGPDAGIDIPNFKAYHPYPLQAVWSGGDKISKRHIFRLWLKQPLFIHEDQFEAALTQLHFEPAIAQQLHLEQLAEGFEIQSFNSTPLTDEAPAIARIQTVINRDHLVPKFDDRHREVYLEGYQGEVPVLYRVPLDENFGEVGDEQVAYN